MLQETRHRKTQGTAGGPKPYKSRNRAIITMGERSISGRHKNQVLGEVIKQRLPLMGEANEWKARR